MKKSPVERMQLNCQAFAEDLADSLSSDGPTEAERSLLIEEVKIGSARSACSSAWTDHTGCASAVDFARRIAKSFDSPEDQ